MGTSRKLSHCTVALISYAMNRQVVMKKTSCPGIIHVLHEYRLQLLLLPRISCGTVNQMIAPAGSPPSFTHNSLSLDLTVFLITYPMTSLSSHDR